MSSPAAAAAGCLCEVVLAWLGIPRPVRTAVGAGGVGAFKPVIGITGTRGAGIIVVGAEDVIDVAERVVEVREHGESAGQFAQPVRRAGHDTGRLREELIDLPADGVSAAAVVKPDVTTLVMFRSESTTVTINESEFVTMSRALVPVVATDA